MSRETVRGRTASAIASGKLIRKPCRICGAKAQAHHTDYNDHLAIDWLCQTHHAAEHTRLHRAGIKIPGSPGWHRAEWVEPLPELVKLRVSARMYKQIMSVAKHNKCSISDAVRILLSNALAPNSAAMLRSMEGQ
jgi:hypothetical protein